MNCKSSNSNVTATSNIRGSSYDNVEPDSLCGVGGASQIRHVDSLQQCRLRRVSVEVELQYGAVAKRDQSNTTDSWTVSDAVDVQRLDHHAYELRYPLEVVEADATGRV